MSSTQTAEVLTGRYRLIDQLGRGGLGRVWKAYDQRLEVEVAIKEVVLPPGTDENSDALKRADREARNAARLRDHPDIVTVHDVVVEGGRPWMVMQLVKGRSLAELLRERGSLSVEETARIGAGVLRALEAAHQAGVVHRDIKPANIMLSDRGEVLLTDFGIAVHHADTSLTQTGMVVGSMEYLAPERVNGADNVPASDLFSLGVTLYHAIMGVSPFSRTDPSSTLSAILTTEVSFPTEAGSLAPLIAQLLEKDPQNRPSLQAALTTTEAASGGPLPPTRLFSTADSANRPGKAGTSTASKTPHWKSVGGLALTAVATVITTLITVGTIGSRIHGGMWLALAALAGASALCAYFGRRTVSAFTANPVLRTLPIAFIGLVWLLVLLSWL